MPELESIGPAIWLAEGGIVDFYGFPYPTRMVVVRLEDGGLWLWSPIAPSEALRTQVESLGPVRHLVSPNKLHHLFLETWRAAYPEARLWGPASTIRKRTDLKFEPALEDHAPSDWAGEIDQFWFRGSWALDELVFFHRASRTAILADLSENFDEHFLALHWGPWARRIARLWKIVEPWGYAPLELRLSWWRRRPARDALERLLACDPLQVVMAHGRWQPTEGRAYLERAFAWLRQTRREKRPGTST